jgi:N-acetylmuramoyl-L-alanine amidase
MIGLGGRINTPWGFGNLEPQGIKILFGGRRLALDVAPVIENDRTLVPVRAALEALGATLEFDEAANTVIGKKDGAEFTLKIDSVNATVNGQPKILDVPAKIINDRTMVPIRFVAENFGANVTWDDANNAVLVD